MFHCYVSLPEGILYSSMTGWWFQPLSWDYEIPTERKNMFQTTNQMNIS